MAEQPRTVDPKIEWTDGEFRISLPIQGGMIDARWRPNTTSVIRIRKVGTDSWSPGFETPLNGCTFVGLQPSTEYEIQVTHKTAVGEGPPANLRCTTRADGGVDNIIPFPKK